MMPLVWPRRLDDVVRGAGAGEFAGPWELALVATIARTARRPAVDTQA
jgi:hypothetical protein